MLGADGFELVGGSGMWRLLGEVDLANRDLFAAALGEAMVDAAECVLDLRDLEFIGVAELRVIVELSRAAAVGVRLVHAPKIVHMCWEAAGFGPAAPHVELVS